MTPTSESPKALFRTPADVDQYLTTRDRGFVLYDDPEDTQGVNKAYDFARTLDAEAGAMLRARLQVQSKESRTHWMKEAERIARASQDLMDALRDLNDRWSKKDQKPS